MTTMRKDSKMLSRALLADALFSGTSGLVIALDARLAADITGVNSPVAFTALGVGLLVWAAFVYRTRQRQPGDSLAAVWGIIAGNLLWAAGSAALLLSNALPLAAAGKWAVGIVADVVLVFAAWQYFGLRRLAS